jgi:hypothetical protein
MWTLEEVCMLLRQLRTSNSKTKRARACVCVCVHVYVYVRPCVCACVGEREAARSAYVCEQWQFL